MAWTLSAAIILGLVAGIWLAPHWRLQAHINRAFSNDPVQRRPAIAQLHSLVRAWQEEWVLTTTGGEVNTTAQANAAPRVTELGMTLLIELQSHASADLNEGTLLDVAGLIKECQLWAPETVPLAIWLRHTQLLLLNADVRSAGHALEQLLTVPLKQEQSAPATDRTMAQDLWHRLLTLHHHDEAVTDEPAATPIGDVSLHALRACARRYGPPAIDPYVSRALNDPLPAIQREAWLLLAAANPDAGFSTAINTTTAPDVTEAILWASITTNPDQAAPLLAAAQQWSTTPARRDAYRTSLYLLGRSTDDTAIHYLSDRARTGDADALTALKLLAARSDADSEVGVLLNEIDDESMVPDINTDLTLLAAGDADAIKRALRATTTPTADGLTPEQEVMTRWLAWYDHAPAEQAGLSAEGGADPVAADGSVWAAVLLAERTLTPGEAADLADTWIHDLDDNVKRAGLLLAGLCGTHPIEIQRLLDEAETVDVRRAARLASGMVSRDDTANRGACRRIAEAESDHPGRFNEALLALLAAGDPDAVDQLLQPGPNLTPARRLLLSAWLLDRFCPALTDDARPLVFNNDRMAQLQLDAMSSYWCLHRTAMEFDRSAGCFRFNRLPDEN